MTVFLIILGVLAYGFIASVAGKTAYKVNKKNCRNCNGRYSCSKEHHTAAGFYGVFWFVTLIATVFLKAGDIVADRVVNRDSHREKKATREKVKHQQKLELEQQKTEQLRLSAEILKSDGVNPETLKVLGL